MGVPLMRIQIVEVSCKKTRQASCDEAGRTSPPGPKAAYRAQPLSV